MVLYKELAMGEVSNRGTVVTVSQIPSAIEKAIESKYPLYASLYSFDEEILNHFRLRSSIKSFKGNFYLEKILFDLDRGSDSDDHVLTKARMFCDFLAKDFNIPEEWIQPYFSGTGFHIEIPECFGFKPSPMLPRTVKTTLMTHFKNIDNIYDGARIVRCVNTVNVKSNLWKVAVPLEDLYNKASLEIRQRAEKPQDFVHEKVELEDDMRLSSLVIQSTEPLISPVQVKTGTRSDFSQVVTCVQSMYDQGPLEGTRHNAIMRMTSAWRRAGVPKEAIKTSLVDWANTMNPEEVSRIVENVFEKDYRWGCNDPLMIKHCSSRCIFYKNRNYSLDIATATDMEQRFAKFAKTDFTHTSFDLQEFYKIDAPYKFYPGEFILVFGDTGMGKTTWIQNLCVDLPRMKILYLSLEVHEGLLYRKFVQIAHNMTKEQVMDHYTQNNNMLSEPLHHIQVVTIAPNLDAIGKIIAEVDPQIVVVDTTDGIEIGGFKEELMAERQVAMALKSLAQQRNVIIFGVHHISKSAASNAKYKNIVFDVHSGKGSSSFEQKADKVIVIEGEEKSPMRIIRSVKARDEAGFKIETMMNKNTFRFTQLQGNHHGYQPNVGNSGTHL